MGLLDDAIKEHLELKRRHGADPGEVARLEHEALGPARRDPAPAAVDEPVAAGRRPRPPRTTTSSSTTTGDARRGDRRGAPRGSDPPRRARAGARAGAGGREAPAPDARPRPRSSSPRASSRSRRSRPPRPRRGSAEPAPAQRRGRGPAAAEDVVPADDEPDSEDVLEETPEFLQETPEHDRLWFEQKPPRDFDF